MLLDRSRRRPVSHFKWRVRLFGAGAILAVVGIYADASWLINLAIAVLAVGILLRFAPGRGGRGPSNVDGASDEDAEPGR